MKGFKSYKEQLEFDPFSKSVNVIVGRNGSGKSNFFSAIRFVMSDIFTNYRPESLLHDGPGDKVMSAFVEIVFDNTNGRFPIEKDEVTLRRAIGLKKDEYFLDKKHITKHDVVNLLESAGFSRSNPYYIVQQGKVNALTLMKDSERLELLKEVAGTRVYDERRLESLKTIKETEGKVEKIVEVLSYIEERLKELESEKEELKEYQQLDRERRSLQYTIYDRELAQSSEELETIEKARSEESSKTDGIQKKLEEHHSKFKADEKELKTLNSELSGIKKEKELIEEERQDLLKTRAMLTLELKELDDKVKETSDRRNSIDVEVQSVQEEIASTEAELKSIQPDFHQQLTEEKTIQESMAERERRLQTIYSKQGRSSQFASKKDRDSHLMAEIAQIQKQLDAERKMSSQVKKDLQGLEKRRAGLSGSIKEKQQKLDQQKGLLDSSSLDINALKTKRDDLNNQRKELWREDGEMETKLQNSRNEMMKAERQLQSSVSGVINAGLQAVKKIVAKHNIQGVYGPIIELLDVNPAFLTAAEVTAGNSLFHVVVDTDETVTKILEILNVEKSGRVTFIPLNKLMVEDSNLPHDNFVRPLLSELHFNPSYKKAFLQIFGKTLVCRSLESANAYAKKHGLNCVTLDGDQVNKKGALTGGYIDVKHSRLESMKQIKKWRGDLDKLSDESKKIKQNLQALEQQITTILGEIQKQESDRIKLQDTLEQLTLDIRTLTREESQLRSWIDEKEKTLTAIEGTKKGLEDVQESMKNELGTELDANLSKEEQNTLRKLNEEVQNYKKLVISAQADRVETETKMKKLQNVLENNLYKLLEKLQDELTSLNTSDLKHLQSQKNADLFSTDNSIQSTRDQIIAIDSKKEEITKRIESLSRTIEEAKEVEKRMIVKIQNESKSLEKILNKRGLLLQKRDESRKKIRDLGSLPLGTAEKYSDKRMSELMSDLQQTNEKLKAFSNVNKKALDQYVTFTEQRSQLLERKTELDNSYQSIQDLIQVLDQKKDEAIERTFKGVAKHFAEVFAELTNGGKASLIMQRKKEGEEEAPEGETEESKRIRSYAGVSIKASFSGGSDSVAMHQLSGGQKSLVALALIFSIQRCDPAPFYIFDEIDAALDVEKRSAVAKMIQKQSSDSEIQFILTTFKPELVKIAKKFYGITYQSEVKVSNIQSIDLESALQLIEEAEKEPTV